MAAKYSAGILLHRTNGAEIEVLLVHPGGPFWAKKDDGAWSVPKGECDPGEDAWATAVREFAEELGHDLPHGARTELGEITQAGGKRVTCFAVAASLDVEEIRSNEFEMEWPPRSGRRQSFPEVDRAEWFTVEAARAKLLAGQVPFLDRLVAALAEG